MAQARLRELRRPGGADRHDAHGPGGAPPLDQRASLPACAKLHHGPAWTRGPAARHLHRLADARHPGRHPGRGPVRAAVARHPDRPDLGLSGLWRRAGGGGDPLRDQAGGHRHRGLRRLAYRLPGPAQRGPVGHRRGGLRGDLRAEYSVPIHRPGGGHHRLRRWAHRPGQVQDRRRSRGLEQDLWSGPDRRPHPDAGARRLLLVAHPDLQPGRVWGSGAWSRACYS